MKKDNLWGHFKPSQQLQDYLHRLPANLVGYAERAVAMLAETVATDRIDMKFHEAKYSTVTLYRDDPADYTEGRIQEWFVDTVHNLAFGRKHIDKTYYGCPAYHIDGLINNPKANKIILYRNVREIGNGIIQYELRYNLIN